MTTTTFLDHVLDGCDPDARLREKGLAVVVLVGAWSALVSAGLVLLNR